MRGLVDYMFGNFWKLGDLKLSEDSPLTGDFVVSVVLDDLMTTYLFNFKYLHLCYLLNNIGLC